MSRCCWTGTSRWLWCTSVHLFIWEVTKQNLICYGSFNEAVRQESGFHKVWVSFPAVSETEMGSAPGFSGNNILQRDLFVYLPWRGNLTSLVCLETTQRKFVSTRAANALSCQLILCAGFDSVLPPGSSRKQPVKEACKMQGREEQCAGLSLCSGCVWAQLFWTVLMSLPSLNWLLCSKK